ncbi:MAG TPA: PaaI family thioesterase [Miltoncostaeaceae bacterium]|nr:PaaI family thioesterase [Miltoncostaeaceae bacterium]
MPIDLEALNALGEGSLVGLLGIEIVAAEDGAVHARLPVRAEVMAPNGFLHAGSVVSLADTACGYGTYLSLPSGAEGFATVELASHHVGTARGGAIECRAGRVHAGRSTQVWDARVTGEGDRAIALFRCTQLILWPRTDGAAP